MHWRVRLDQTLQALEMGAKLAAEKLETGITFNPMRKEMRSDPHPFYKALRERDPRHRSRPADGWVLSRFEDVHTVLAERRFSADERNLRRWKKMVGRRLRAGLADPYEEDRASMLRMDAPDHTRLRKLVNKAFTPRAVEAMRGRIERLVDEQLSRFRPGEPIELIGDFASPFPVTIIAEMLGVPPEDHARFRHWSDEAIRNLGDGDLEDARHGETAMIELGEYLKAVADARRDDPRDDLITGLVQAEEEGDRLRNDELATMCVLLLVAGNETTTKLIANSMVALIRNPEQLAILREEPKRIAGAVDELLRYDGPVQLTSRMVLEDEDFDGCRFEKGQQIVLLLAAANRDPEQFDRPDELDVTRENVRHLAFSHGAHFCLGAQLARLEASLALEGLVTRFPDIGFGDAPITWGSNTVLRGPTSLPLRL